MQQMPGRDAYLDGLLEHHFASLRLGINSAPQLPQISMRLVDRFRRELTIRRSFVMRRIFV